MSNINFQIDELDQLSVLEPNNEATMDRCVICYEDIDSKPTYELPECNHKFHQSCINAWFRQGNAKCPLCNNIGSGLNSDRYRGSIWSDWPIKFNYLRRFSKKKNANDLKNSLVKKLNPKFPDFSINVDFDEKRKLYKLISQTNDIEKAKKVCSFSKEVKINCLFKKQ